MAALLVLVFLVVPITEIWLIIQVGQTIGGWPTLGLLVAESVFGGWLVRREGRRAWWALRTSFGSGRLPDRELTDGALVLVGGTLLLTPGFLTDVLGFALVLPVTRPVARRVLRRWIARRAKLRVMRTYGPGGPRPTAGPGRSVRPDGRVVPGEVVQPPGHPDQPGHGGATRPESSA
jgi:UPF0716 protein FxsA